MVCFSIFLHTFANKRSKKPFRVMTASNPHRHIKKRLIKTVGAHTPCSCGYMQNGELYFYIKDYQGNVRVVLNQANRPVEVNSYYPYGGLMAATTTEGTQPYKYSTKELDRENGLDWYDFHARQSLYYCRQNIKRKTASSDNVSWSLWSCLLLWDISGYGKSQPHI